MWHGTLEGDAFRSAVLALVGDRLPSPVGFAQAREARLDLLGDLVERHLDVDSLLDLSRTGPPPGLSLLPPGGAT
jgi:adenosylcobyric acid synthase